ncbi:MAG: hypothetical protein IKJ89_09455 [Kiritimatiellae bacterium]|nr:hypothetical protein [Kiritimatiellia bacterium]
MQTPTTLVTLPCTARDLEAALHSYCDAHAAWDAQIALDWKNPHWTVATPILTLSCAPSVTSADETTNPNKE